MVSPPKPWERAANIAAAESIPSSPSNTVVNGSATPAASSSSSTVPTVPERPPAFTSALTNSPFSSPFSRFGTPYGGYGGGYGGIGSYGGMGYGMGGLGYGGMGYGSMGYGGVGLPPFGPNGQPTLTQTLSSTTEQTFALLHSIVQTFSGVAQMLESTFMATHSSFFAMVGVVEQIGHLRNALGSVLGLFGLFRWMKDVLTGNPPSGSMQHEFRQFIDGRPVQGPKGPPRPKPSKKPLIIFLLAVIGIPYVMHKLVKILNEKAAKEGIIAPSSPLDPSQLSFGRALYPFNASSPTELSLKEDEIVAIVGKLDPRTGAEVDPRLEVEGGEWWKGRTRDGREGWFPRKWVQIIEKTAKPKQVD